MSQSNIQIDDYIFGFFNLKSRLCDFQNLNKYKKKSYLSIYLCDKNLLAQSVSWVFREKRPNVF